MIDDTALIDLLQEYFCKKLAQKLDIPFESFHTIMLIGSSVQPETMSSKSDIDVVVFIEDHWAERPANFKAGMQTLYKNQRKKIKLAVDIKIYTLCSFRNELYHDSLTRVFAILNAYRIIYSADNTVTEIIIDGNNRMNDCVELSIDHLKRMNVALEIKNLKNYFNNARSALQSERIRDNGLLLQLRLFEYMKEFIVQFQLICYAMDLKKGIQDHEIAPFVKNLMVFQNTDGTRLLDPGKYLLDSRVKELLTHINMEIFHSKPDLIAGINSLFDCINAAFIRQTGSPLLTDQENYEYFSYFKMNV